MSITPVTSTPFAGNAGQTSNASGALDLSGQSTTSRPRINLAGLPIFSGKGSENVREFFSKISHRALLEQWTEIDTVNVVKYQVTGEAFELLESEDLLRDADVTYRKIEKFLTDKYTKKVIPGQGFLKLGKCVQHHKETVAEYATRLRITGKDLLKENMATVDITEDADVKATKKRHERDLILQLQRGVNPDIAKLMVFEMARHPVDSFEEAVELAQQAEISSEVLQQSRKPQEWRVLETTERPSTSQESSRQFDRRNNHPTRQVRCFKCNQEGHIAPECGKKQIICYNCGKPGHVRYECRKIETRRNTSRIQDTAYEAPSRNGSSTSKNNGNITQRNQISRKTFPNQGKRSLN